MVHNKGGDFPELYCKRLEFWLFEDNGLIERGNNRDVVVRYASDFLDDPSIPVEFKCEINELVTYGNKLFEEMDRIIAGFNKSDAKSNL